MTEEKIAVTIAKLEIYEKNICDGECGTPFKQLLRDAVEIIRELYEEKRNNEREYISREDPYKPLWPNWED